MLIDDRKPKPEKDYRPPQGYFAESLHFPSIEQRLLYDALIKYLTSFNIYINIFIRDNRAYFATPNSYPCLCVYPNKDENLHFEFSKNLNKDLTSDNNFPVYVSDIPTLESLKMALKILFITKNPENFSETPVKKSSEGKNTSSLQHAHASSLQVQKVGAPRQKTTEANKSINRFFGK